MKYCLSARQPEMLLKKADEIKFELRDIESLANYIQDYPDKDIIIEIPVLKPENFTWESLAIESHKANGRLHCALSDLKDVGSCRSRKINFYYKHPATSFFELNGLKDLGVSQVVVGIPLIFDLPSVKMICGDIPLRAVPNLAYQPYIKHSDGVCGGWIRPEDTEAYGKYISTFEFYSPTGLKKEASMFHVYAENKSWPGNLRLLIDYLDYDVDNRLFLDDENLALRRMSCKQKCMNGGACHYCYNQFHSSDLIKKYGENKAKGVYGVLETETQEQ